MQENKLVILLEKESNFILVFPMFVQDCTQVLNKYEYH